MGETTGKTVQTKNLSQHTGLTLPDLMAELGRFKDQLAKRTSWWSASLTTASR